MQPIMPVTIKIKKFIVYSLNIAISIIEGFLLFRVVLKLLNANTSPFVEWVYDVSGSILSPFEGMFQPLVTENGHILEFTTLFTIAFYGIMYYFAYQIVNIIADVIVKNTKPEQPAQNQTPTQPQSSQQPPAQPMQ